MYSKKGFTLIELVMVIVILGILAAIAIPRFYDLQQEARQAAEEGIVGGVRAGISTYYANECMVGTCGWPPALDSNAGADCDVTVCFDDVLEQGGVSTDDWTKSSDGVTYTGPAGGSYAYDSTDGSFM